MIAIAIILSFTVTTLLLRRGKSKSKASGIIKVSERAWIINNKFIDLDAEEARAKDVARMDKMMFDFEVDVARREFEMREKLAKERGTINMIGPRRVIMFNGKIMK